MDGPLAFDNVIAAESPCAKEIRSEVADDGDLFLVPDLVSGNILVKDRAAIEATGRKNILLAGLWTEVCVTWPTLNMLDAGYNVYIVEDACGATSQAAHDAALRRMVQAGAVPMTTIATVLEFQRDWANREHYDALLAMFREHGGAYGSGIEYAYSMVHKAPQAAANPHVVAK